MKCFKVTANGIEEGLKVMSAPYPHVPIGEAGRGRKLVKFPMAQRWAQKLFKTIPCPHQGELVYNIWRTIPACPKCGVEMPHEINDDEHCRHPQSGMTVPDQKTIYQASVLTTKEKGTRLLVEEQQTDKRALIHLAIQGGFRGSSHASFPDEGVIILANGYAAEGAAGRAGGPHNEYLIIAEPGVIIKIERYGRLYGGPSELVITWDGERIKAGTADEIEHPSCETPEGEII